MRKFFSRTGFAALLILLATGLFSTSAMAQKWHKGHYQAYVLGTISSINPNGRSFTVVNEMGEKTEVAVSPQTKFKLKNTDPRFRGKKHDIYVHFSDLRVNDWVRAKIFETHNAGWQTKDVHIFVDNAMTRFVDPTRPSARGFR